jgi:hypothetical protein
MNNSRRDFLEKLTLGSAVGIPALMSSITTQANVIPDLSLFEGADDWFKKVKGKHKIIYDATKPNENFPVIWS